MSKVKRGKRTNETSNHINIHGCSARIGGAGPSETRRKQQHFHDNGPSWLSRELASAGCAGKNTAGDQNVAHPDATQRLDGADEDTYVPHRAAVQWQRDRSFRHHGEYAAPRATGISDQARVRSNVTVNRDRSFRNRTFSGNTATNVGVNRNRNVTVTNNWRGSRFSGQQYAAFRNYHRQWHDRGWWSSHYNRIIFVGGGWYFWDGGYWYPAWGYDPYAYYPYDGPIYGYGNLTPDQIVVEVQTQLQRDGYYAGPIDGQLGPMTRQAIAAFQADHGLAITSTVDEPTLSRLGLS